MKRHLSLLLPVLLLLLSLGSALTEQTAVHAQTAGNIEIYLNGQRLNSDVPPYILPEVNATMVPIRVISEGLGAGADWSESGKTATIRGSAVTIAMTRGQSYAMVNGSRVALNPSVQIRQGRVMVPLRFVGEQLGLKVDWIQDRKEIRLTSASAGAPAPVGAGTLRGAWVSTVYNLDWPSAQSYGNEEMQKEEYARLLDDLQGMGINAVFVQVRSAADALYPSELVPWSKALTGRQGQDPGYDPLQYLIEETHRRGMQFHAWFNPFRASTGTGYGELAANHVAVQHPDWIVQAGNQLYINPGIPEARRHIIDAVMEVVRKYDIDGVHLDDYFYPTGGTFDDDAAFRAYNDGNFAGKADWRRDNINRFVQELGQAIHQAKPQVQFGISPYGVWRNRSADPAGSDTKASITAYDSTYADVRTWIRQGWIDYVAPQIYWSLTFPAARYDTLTDWWANEVRGTSVKLYIGHAPYKLGTAEAGWQSADEIIRQLQYNGKHPEVKGDLFFSAKDLRGNPLGVADALRAYYGVQAKAKP